MKRSTSSAHAILLTLTLFAIPGLSARGAAPALEFTATTDTVALETNILCNAAFTVEYWLRSTNSATYAVIHSTNGNNYAVRHDPYNWIRKIGMGYVTQNSGLIFFQPSATFPVTFYDSDNLEDDAWTHVAVTRDATNSLQVYLNGVALGARTWTGELRFNRIGGGLLGRVAEVRVWDHARTATAIEFDRHRRLTGTETGLRGYWPLDDAAGTTAQDLSPATNDGTLSGADWAEDADLVLVANDNSFVPATPLTLADLETDSAEFTNSNEVDVAAFPVPPDVDQYQITLSADPGDLSFAPGAWTNTATPPSELTFPTPATDTNVTLYAWFTNSATSVTLRRATGSIRYTTATPAPSVPPALARETAGFTVRLLPAEFDLGSTGGTTGGEAIPVHRLELVDLSLPAADLTPGEDFRTLPATAGAYSFALRVINAAGTAALSATCTVTLATTGALPAGDRFVAIGNLNQATPYATWTTAAADIQTAVDEAAADDIVRIARGTYHGSGAQIVSITQPLQLIGAHPREEVILDGGNGAFGNRRGIVATMPAPGDPAPVLRIENLTVTRCFEQSQWGSAGLGIRIVYSAVTNGTAVIRNCVLSGNRLLKGDSSGTESGAGIYCLGASGSAFHVALSQSRFEDNFTIGRVPLGAGFSLNYGRVTIEACEFLGNAAMGQQAQESYNRTGNGGGVGIANVAANSWIRNCLFEGNRVSGGYGGGLDIQSGVALTVENSIFRANQSFYVGAARLLSGSSASTNVVRNCLIAGNQAGAWGGGLASGTTSTTGVRVENCTIVDNACVAVSGGGGGIFGFVVVHNSILRENTPNNGNFWGTGARYYSHCCTTPITDGGGNNYLEGNLDADPQFVDAPGGDYRLTRTSPCRDKGLNQDWMIGAKDLDGKPRRDAAGAGTVDIGAYEYQTPATLLLIR